MYRPVSLLGLMLIAIVGCDGEPGGLPRANVEVGSVQNPIIGQAMLCGGCDPNCFLVEDIPTGADLTEEVAQNLRFDLDANGVVATGEDAVFTRRYDGRLVCDGQRRPMWSQFYWEAETPDGTSIEISLRAAETFAEFAEADYVSAVMDPGDWSPADIAAELEAAELEPSSRYFGVEVALHMNDTWESPILRSVALVYYCLCECDVDSECSRGCFCDDDCGVE